MLEKPAFIQGVFAFEGRGLASPGPFPKPATYTSLPLDDTVTSVGMQMLCARSLGLPDAML